MKYDIIGDIHGQLNKLTDLLSYMGYLQEGDVWKHPTRIAIFVGDLIDGLPASESVSHVETVRIVRKMVESGSALCILGNHEFNAIAFTTKDPDSSGEYLRRHSDKNMKQHKAFLDEVVLFSDAHLDIITWFKKLPLWLELEDGIRVIHAAWVPKYQDILRPYLNSDNTMKDNLLNVASKEGSPEFEALEVLCKGLEVKLPEGVSFQDKHDIKRTHVRVPWWLKSTYSSYKKEALVSESIRECLPDLQMVPDKRIVKYEGMPVFFGHYWLQGTPHHLESNIACVDYSAGRNGSLIAYRWNGEHELKQDGFAFI